MPRKSATQRPIRARLIFNTLSGQLQASPQLLADIIMAMQDQAILPEVTMIRPDSNVEAAVRGAIKSGIRLIVVAGGDGTIESVAGALINSPATLGIIPTGTRNNLAFNLGIPADIPGAVALLRGGIPRRIDVGQVRSGRERRWFLEVASLGLLSDLYPYADNLQKGDVIQIANLLSAFVGSMPSRLRLKLDDRKPVDAASLIALIVNMSYVGPRFQISPRVSPVDARLDVFLFPDMTQLDLLITYASQPPAGELISPAITHYRARKVTITSDPPMPILADSTPAGRGRATLAVHPAALNVMTGPDMVRPTRRKAVPVG